MSFISEEPVEEFIITEVEADSIANPLPDSNYGSIINHKDSKLEGNTSNIERNRIDANCNKGKIEEDSEAAIPSRSK
jgi:hypothetical protein